jgi:hypothetical protein
MAQAARLNLRMQKEIKLLLHDPPPGVSLNISEDESALSSLSNIEASMTIIFYYLLHCLLSNRKFQHCNLNFPLFACGFFVLTKSRN